MKWLVAGLVILAPAWGGEPSCAVAEKESWSSLSRTALVKDDRGAIRQGFLIASGALPDCQQNETLWYVLLRASELGFGMFPVGGRVVELKSFDDALRAGRVRFPQSVRLATIAARHAGTVEESQKAVALDPRYTPAQVELAAAQLATGNSKAAVAILTDLKDLNRIAGAHVLLSRALLANGNSKGAIDAARQESLTDVLDPWEPGNDVNRDFHREATEAIGMAHLAADHYRAAARQLIHAAADGSDSAVATLQGNPKLRTALVQLINDGRLPASETGLANRLSRAGR
jgi:hypothetical protein